MPGYYIVQWKVNAYTLQKIYTCHAFDPPVLIPEGKLVCQAKFMEPMRKIPFGITSHMNQYLFYKSKNNL